MSSASPFQFQSAKFFGRSEVDRGVHTGEYPIAGIDIHIDMKIVEFGTAVTDDIPLTAKRPENTASRAINIAANRSLPLDIRTDTQAEKQTNILIKVKSAKDNISKLCKTATGRVSPTIPNPGPCVRQHGTQNVYPPPTLTPISQGPISGICDVPRSGSLPSEKSRLAVVTSLVAYSEYAAEEHVDEFICISRCAAEAPSLLSPAQLLKVSESQRIPPSAILLNELPTIEEEDSESDDEGLHMESKVLITSSSCAPLTTSGSEAKYDAMLAAEFATFSFDSKDIQEWSDEVEREKQAKMDTHFAYVSEALVVPVPKLSAYFVTGSRAEFPTVDRDEAIGAPSPVKTENSETNTSSADSSLVTSVDAEEDRPQVSPVILRGFRRVRDYEDLKVCLL